MLESDTRLVRVVLVLLALLCFYRFWVRDLSYYDEPRYAGVAKETCAASSWAMPLLYDAPYTEKPPLYFWAAGLCGRLFGFNSFAYFLPNVLAHFLTVLLVYDLGRRTLSRRAGAFAALALAACPLSLHFARSAQLDALLVLGETLSAYGLLLALQTGSLAFGLLGAIGLALGSLVKGHVVLVSLIAPLAYCALKRDFSFLRRPAKMLLGMVVALGPFFAWFAFVVADMGFDQAIDVYFNKQVLEHTAGRVNHFAPWPVGKQYLAALALMLPFVAFLPGAFRRRENNLFQRTYLWWGMIFFTLFALIPAKREIYLMPLVVPLALVVGDYLSGVDVGRWPLFRGGREIGLCLSALLLLGAVGLPIALVVLGGLSLDAVLAGVIGTIAGLAAVRAFARRRASAPLLILLQIAIVSVFAEPAVGGYTTAHFGERVFGEAIQRHVPAQDTVIILGFTKAHAIRLFGERRLRFIEESEELEPLLKDGGTLFVVTKKKDARRLAKRRELQSTLLFVEPWRDQGRAFLLFSVSSSEADPP